MRLDAIAPQHQPGSPVIVPLPPVANRVAAASLRIVARTTEDAGAAADVLGRYVGDKTYQALIPGYVAELDGAVAPDVLSGALVQATRAVDLLKVAGDVAFASAIDTDVAQPLAAAIAGIDAIRNVPWTAASALRVEKQMSAISSAAGTWGLALVQEPRVVVPAVASQG